MGPRPVGGVAAYATLSPVFATASKPGYGPALGIGGLAAGCRSRRRAGVAAPSTAVGGIGPVPGLGVPSRRRRGGGGDGCR